jgi:hypothetical protein
MCRPGVLQGLARPLGLRQRVVPDPHTAHPTDIMGTGVFTYLQFSKRPPSELLGFFAHTEIREFLTRILADSQYDAR